MWFSLLLALAATLPATEATISKSAGSSIQGGFCAEIRSLHGNNASTLPIPGKLAYHCLQSLPFRADLGVSFINELTKYVQFHSTLEILKNPPRGYLSPPTDILGGLENISQRATNGEYRNQFEFDTDISRVIQSANDGHFFASFCSTSIFSFKIPISLVSISADGVQMPQIYTYNDAEVLKTHRYSVSPLVSIDGTQTSEFVEKLASSRPFQDPDARYNSLFASPSSTVPMAGAGPSFIYESGLWPGAPTYHLEFANGTKYFVDTIATIASDLYAANFASESSLFKAACLPTAGSPMASSSRQQSARLPPEGTSFGYPEAILHHPYNLIAGSYLSEDDLQDIAVLSVFTFQTSEAYGGQALPHNSTRDFSRVALDFLKKASVDGKKRILIDLSGNSGGDLTAGFNLFRLFFPDVPIYTATRFRSHEAASLIGQTFQQLTPLEENIYSRNPLAYQVAVSPDQARRFASWSDFYGPYKILEMNSSNLFASFNMTERSQDNDPISGYGTVPLQPSRRLFAAEDILMVTDGLCASTCALFVEHMKEQGVRSIVFGGRPRLGPMQAVGGVKGGQSAGVRPISHLVTTGLELAIRALNTSTPLLTKDQVAAYRRVTPIPVEEFPLQMHGGVVNLRNQYREGDDITPLQFVYKAADCRLFYQAENYLDSTTVWINAARAALGGYHCVNGSEEMHEDGHNELSHGSSGLCLWPWPAGVVD
ncbi:hypothetical protein PENCOP_c013G07600 [Penicillium coprophilum]|uniref:Uncharacterized protein n=1 Tax=Penicillium coprophilum TaxID=36646 RepID=A0A1V6UAG4_9EURO|nr:hypothetical protein PENCOP_c013G07600 [Penicillium coprophilum]